MIFLRIVSVVAGILLLWFMVTQLLWPMVKGTRLLPTFRPERAKVVDDVTAAREERDLELLRDEARRVRHDTDEIKRP